MKPGVYVAEVTNIGIRTSKKGDQMPFIEFKTEAGESITWTGWLGSDKGKDYAIKALFLSGFLGDDWSDLASPVPKFIKGHKVSITVEEEIYQDKKRPRVKWINQIKEAQKLSQSEVKAKMSDAGLFAKAKALHGIKNHAAGGSDAGF